MCACVHLWKISEFLHTGFTRPPKLLKVVISKRWVLWGEVQLKWHNVRRWKSFWGLVDMPGMCLGTWVLVGMYGLGAMSPKNPNFSDRCRRLDSVSDNRSARRLYACLSRFNITLEGAECPLRAYILHIYCNPSSLLLQSIVMSMSVSLSVLSHNSKTIHRTSPTFCVRCLWSWIGIAIHWVTLSFVNTKD